MSEPKIYVLDETLSAKAKGLLTTMLHLTEPCSLETLRGLSTDGETAIRTGVNELIAAGYVVRTRKRNSDGAYAGVRYGIRLRIPTEEDVLN